MLSLRFAVTPLIGILLSGCSDNKPPRPTDTEIRPADYAECLHDFKVCKGKFIKFEGVIVRAGGGSSGNVVRISTPMHGFDVEMSQKMDANIVGCKVLFSGYLDEDHTFNDDVSRGEINDLLMNPREVNAEKERLEAEKKAYEDAHPTCATNWKVCTSNSDLVENSSVWLWKVKSGCESAADDAARYGKPNWSWVPFGSYLKGDDYPKTGIVTAIDEDVSFQNGFGTYGRSRVVCVYDLNTDRVINVSVRLL
jgi:hypothetical protein